MADNIKVGARHSAGDQRLIQEIHDHALALGAAAPIPVAQTGGITVSTVTDPAKALPADALIYSGSAVKALGGGKIGGYLVLFGTPDQTDLAGDYFTKDTDFGGAQTSPVLYQHGMDPSVGLSPVGAGPLKMDDIGIWIEAQLNMRTAYEKAVYGMAEADKLGWSSGTAAHLVKREMVAGGKASRITSWPLGLDASLTPTPAEPRTRALPLKSLSPTQTLQALIQAAGDAAIQGDAAGGASPTTTHSTEGHIMSDSIETKVDALAAQVSTLVAAMTANTKAEVKAAAAAPGFDIPGVEVKDVKAKDIPRAPFKRMGDFLKSVRLNALGEASYEERAQLLDHQQNAIKANGLNTQVGAEGGFLVGPNDSKQLAERMYSTGEILSRVQRDPVSANSNGMTMFGVDETSRATGSRFGGVRAYWAAEGATVTKSKPSFKEVNLKLSKLLALVYTTDEMLADSTYLESHVRRVVPLEMAFQAEDAIVNGSGAGQALGILNSPALVTQTKESAQTATTLNINNLAKMWARLIASSQSNAVLLINQDVISNLFAIVSANVSTNPNGAVFVQPPSQASKYFTYLGRPIIPVEYCATLGTIGDAILCDLGQYQLIDKGDIQEAVSMHVQFLTDEQVYRFTYRVAGAPMWSSALTPFKGSNTLSPYVVVETRS